ncbi:MAG: hypothetical protein CL878_00915 [Dehalococcoidia bacterium]|nr:hypothetical protein [Dehalococcoidia bacterium]
MSAAARMRDVLGDSFYEEHFAPAPAHVSMMFVQIHGWDEMLAGMDSDDAVKLANSYFTVVEAAVYEYQGVLDQFLSHTGTVSIFWGRPLDQPNHADLAVQTALAVRSATQAWNERQQASEQPQLDIGIGIAAGDALVGDFGTRQRVS